MYWYSGLVLLVDKNLLKSREIVKNLGKVEGARPRERAGLTSDAKNLRKTMWALVLFDFDVVFTIKLFVSFDISTDVICNGVGCVGRKISPFTPSK